MPRRDLLLYTPGVTNEHEAFLRLFEIDPVTGEDRLFFRQKLHPQVIDVALSPSGRWLAFLRWKSDENMVVRFVEVMGREHVRSIRLLEDTSLVDWGASPAR
jgi:hypothetical protein